MPDTQAKFDHWAIVEIMGHQRLAGHVTEVTIAGAPMLRVDVPELPRKTNLYGTVCPASPAFTTFIGAASIYRLTPCSEETATAAADAMRSRSPA